MNRPKVHPVAELLPMLGEAELDQMAARALARVAELASMLERGRETMPAAAWAACADEHLKAELEAAVRLDLRGLTIEQSYAGLCHGAPEGVIRGTYRGEDGTWMLVVDTEGGKVAEPIGLAWKEATVHHPRTRLNLGLLNNFAVLSRCEVLAERGPTNGAGRPPRPTAGPSTRTASRTWGGERR